MAVTFSEIESKPAPKKARENADAAGPDDMDNIIEARVRARLAEEVQAEVQKQLADIKESLKGVTAGPSSAGDGNWMEALALAISNVTDQEIGRRRVAPEEIAKRTRAREALEKLIEATIEAGVQPLYTLTRGCYLSEQWIQPFYVGRDRRAHPTEVGWWGIPNQYMNPVNDEAKAISELFLASIGDVRKTDPTLRVTAGGLVVRSGGLNPSGGRDTAPKVGRDLGVSIKGRGSDEGFTETRILGTLTPPARSAL